MQMGFNAFKGNFIKKIEAPKDFTNVMTFGRTGSGKTTGAILPILEDRIKSDYGLLIYDFKGNLHLQTKYLANKHKRLDDVIEIGKPWGEKINLLDYLTAKQSRNIVCSRDGLNSNYWDNASKNLFSDIYTINKNMNFLDNELQVLNHEKRTDHSFSYKTIFDRSSDVESLNNYYININKNILPSIKMRYSKLLNKFEDHPRMGIISDAIHAVSNSLINLKMYEKIDVSSDSGKAAVVNHLSSFMGAVASKDYLNTSDINIIDELRSGKIVVIDVSDLNENILDMINLSIYSRLQKINSENLKPVSIIVDEAQKILSANYLPETDVCREHRFEYIFATQDESLLINKLSEHKYAELISNVATRYSFATNDNEIEETHQYVDLSKLSDNTSIDASSYYAEPIFINRKNLIKIEHSYQKSKGIHDLCDYNSKATYIIKFDAKLYEEYKILVETLKGEQLEANLIKKLNIINSDKKDTSLSFEELVDYLDEDDVSEIVPRSEHIDLDKMAKLLNNFKNKDEEVVIKREMNDLKKHVNNCLRSTASIIKVNDRLKNELHSIRKINSFLENRLIALENNNSHF